LSVEKPIWEHTKINNNNNNNNSATRRDFLVLKVINKTVKESIERYVDQITQNVIALLNIWKI
jgi:hypothetical protein